MSPFSRDMAAAEPDGPAALAERGPWVTRWFANPVISTALGLVGLRLGGGRFCGRDKGQGRPHRFW